VDGQRGTGSGLVLVTEPSAGVPLQRVLVVHPAMAPYRIDLFNLLARRFDLHVLFLDALPPYDANLRREDLAAALECDWSVMADDCRSPSWALPGRLRREMASFAPDALVTHEFGLASGLSTLTPFLGPRAARVLWTTRSTAQLDRLRASRRAAIRLLAPRADALLAYSEASRARLAEIGGVPASHIFVCANHQDAVRLHGLADSIREAVVAQCRAMDLLDKPLVVTVGRLVPIKDIATTIRGFEAAGDVMRDAALVIIGEGPLRGELKACARDAGIADRVVFLGHVPVPEVQGWLSLASLTVLASLAEPFGAVVAEGLAHGVPCICSTAAGAAVLVDEPSRGVTVQPGDVGAMAAALKSRTADLQPAAAFAQSRRKDLRPLTVLDDAWGFGAAIDYAVASRGARRKQEGA
jgi:glycosyltransferase involved in cell wall biosynthesis